MQNSPNMPELYTRAKAPGPTYFLVGLHRLLDRAERVNVLPFFPTGRLAPTIPRYSAEPPGVDRDTRDRQQGSAIPPLTEVRGFLAEMSMKLMNGRRPVHPGEVLRENFLRPARLSASALAKALRVPAPRINQILRERRGISADTAMRLARYFHGEAQAWMNLQARYDLRRAEISKGRRIRSEVKPSRS